MRSKKKTDFDGLVGRIQATSEALQQDALVVINRSVTTRAWLMGLACLQHTMPTPTTPDPEDNCIIHDLTGHSTTQQRTCKYI